MLCSGLRAPAGSPTGSRCTTASTVTIAPGSYARAGGGADEQAPVTAPLGGLGPDSPVAERLDGFAAGREPRVVSYAQFAHVEVFGVEQRHRDAEPLRQQLSEHGRGNARRAHDRVPDAPGGVADDGFGRVFRATEIREAVLEAVAEPLDSPAQLAVAQVDLLQPDAAEILVGRLLLTAVALEQHRRERLGGDVEELDREQRRIGLGVAEGLPIEREDASEAAPLRVMLGRAHELACRLRGDLAAVWRHGLLGRLAPLQPLPLDEVRTRLVGADEHRVGGERVGGHGEREQLTAGGLQPLVDRVLQAGRLDAHLDQQVPRELRYRRRRVAAAHFDARQPAPRALEANRLARRQPDR
jgi:hypothetical protein